MSTAASRLATVLDTIVEKAPDLRAAGVLTVSVGDVHVTLEPSPSVVVDGDRAAEPDRDFLDPAKFRKRDPELEDDYE